MRASPLGSDSLARRHHLKAEPPLGVGAELDRAETKVVHHHCHRVLAGGGDGADVQPPEAGAESPCAQASSTRATHLVLLLINQLVALNSKPASAGGGSRVWTWAAPG